MTPQSGRIGSFCRIYSVLLYAYPRDFRLQYGAAMQQVFRDRCRDLARTAGPWPCFASPSIWQPTGSPPRSVNRAAAFWSAGRKQTPRGFVTEWAVTLGIYLFVTTTLVQAYVIPTGSMEGTLRVGDHMLVDRVTFAEPGSLGARILPYRELKHGDIVAFLYPEDIRQTYVKRVIGLPGDRIRLDKQQVIRNGRRLIEPYTQHIATYPDPYRDNFPLSPEAYTTPRGRDMFEHHVLNGEVIVPPDMLFVLGDNRENSADSRYWGFVPRSYVVGKPLFVYWSYDAPTADLTGVDSGPRARRGPAFLHQDPLGTDPLSPTFAGGAGSRRRPMKAVGLAVFGWLVPGGAYLLMRRYLQFAVFAVLVSATFAAGLALHGGYAVAAARRTPGPGHLHGIGLQSRGLGQTARRRPVSARPALRRLLMGSWMDACTSMEPRCWSWRAFSTCWRYPMRSNCERRNTNAAPGVHSAGGRTALRRHGFAREAIPAGTPVRRDVRIPLLCGRHGGRQLGHVPDPRLKTPPHNA